MARISINELTTYRWSFEEDVAHYKAAGISAIGVWRQKLSDYGEEKGIELLHEAGLEVSNLLWAGGFTGSCGRSYRDSIDDALDAIRLASAMRCPCLVVYSGGRGGHTRNHARRLLVGALQEVAPLAEQEGVALAIEPMRPECAGECTFLTSADDALEMIDAVGSPQVKLAFDTYHLGQDPNVLDRISQFADHIAIVHFGDGKQPREQDQNRCPLGAGTIPLREIACQLAAAGYDGHYDVELLGEEIEAMDYDRLLQQSIEACHQLLAVNV